MTIRKWFHSPKGRFVVIMVLTVGYGMYRFFAGSLGAVIAPPHFEAHNIISVITPFILLHAFANGTTALTGVEAISNGVSAFKPPEWKNAIQTMAAMAVLLGFLFIGVYFTGRFLVEFVKEFQSLEAQESLLTMGQYLSIPFMIVGALGVVKALRDNEQTPPPAPKPAA